MYGRILICSKMTFIQRLSNFCLVYFAKNSFKIVKTLFGELLFCGKLFRDFLSQDL
jgi:hypothetical protein